MYGDESPHPNPTEREIVANWIERFLTAPDDAPENLEKVAIFRSPDIRAGLDGKSIRDVEDYQHDLSKMKQLIWDDSQFTPVTPDDVGFTLSTDAELFLTRATGEASTSIRRRLASFASNITTYLQVLAEGIVYHLSEEDAARLIRHASTLQTVSFESCNNAPTSSPRSCIDQIVSELSDLVADMEDSVFSDIDRTTNFLQFTFAEVGKEKQYDMEDWVAGLYGLDTAVFQFLVEVEANATTAIISNLTQFSDVAHNHFLQTFILLTTLPTPTDLRLFNQTVGELAQLRFTNCVDSLPNSPSACFEEVYGKISSILEATGSSLKDDIRYTIKLRDFLSLRLNITSGLGKVVEPLTSLRLRVEQTLEEKDIPVKIFNLMLNELSELAVEISTYVLSHTEENMDLEELIVYLNKIETELKGITTTLESYNTRGSLAGFVELVISEYAKIPKISEKTSMLDIIYMIELLKIYPWFAPAWITFHRDNLINPVSGYIAYNKRPRIIYYKLGARNVPNNEPGGRLPDPYAKVFFESKNNYFGRTDTKDDNGGPDWDNRFQVTYNPGGKEQFLIYEVWDEDVVYDDYLCEGPVSVRKMYRNKIGTLSEPMSWGARIYVYIYQIDSTRMDFGQSI